MKTRIVKVSILVTGILIGSVASFYHPAPTAKAAIASLVDLRDMSTYRQHRIAQKAVTGPANNAEVNIINIPSGSGVINYLWLADRPGAGGGYPEFDHSIRIYANGSSTPDVDTDLGLFFGYAYGDIFPAGNISTENWQARIGGSAHLERAGGSFRLPIPFTNGIRIAVANTNNTPTSLIFSQVDYELGSENSGMTVPAYTLKAISNKWIGGRQTATAGSDATLATIPAGNPGVVVGHSMAAGGANYSYLERQLQLTVDGNNDILSSGTEDWFGASDYFSTGQSPYSSHGSMGFGADNANGGFSALDDFLAINGGYAFNSTATLKWLTHPAATANAAYGSTLWYYRHN